MHHAPASSICLHDRPSSRRLAASVTVAPLLPAPAHAHAAPSSSSPYADAPQHPQPHPHPCSRHASTPRYPHPCCCHGARWSLPVQLPVQLPAQLCHAHAMCLYGCTLTLHTLTHVALHFALRPVPVRVSRISVPLFPCLSLLHLSHDTCRVCAGSPPSRLSRISLSRSLSTL